MTITMWLIRTEESNVTSLQSVLQCISFATATQTGTLNYTKTLLNKCTIIPKMKTLMPAKQGGIRIKKLHKNVQFHCDYVSSCWIDGYICQLNAKTNNKQFNFPITLHKISQ